MFVLTILFVICLLRHVNYIILLYLTSCYTFICVLSVFSINCSNCSYIEYLSTWVGFELATVVVKCTDCIDSCKFNYHAITTTSAPQNIWEIIVWCNAWMFNTMYLVILFTTPKTMNNIGGVMVGSNQRL